MKVKKTIKKTIKKTVAAFMCLIMVFTCFATSASAATPTSDTPINGGKYEIFSAVGYNKCLDVSGNGTSDGTNVEIYHRNGTGAQEFQLVSVGSGYYKIVHLSSGKIIDANGYGYSESNVTTWSDHYGNCSGDNQIWRFVDAGDGYYYIINKCGYYLDVAGANSSDGTNVWVYTGNKSIAQKWKLVAKSLIESNINNVTYIKQSSRTCKASSLAMSLNLVVGNNIYTTSSLGNNSCTNINGKKYVGSNGITYIATYKTDSYVGSYSEEINAIDKALSNGVPIVAAVHSTKASGTKHHWIVVVGKSDSDYLIVDPAIEVFSGSMYANIKTMSSLNYKFGLTDYAMTHYGYITFTKNG